MATVYQWLAPDGAQFLASSFPQLVKNNGSNFPVLGLAYDATADEAAFWCLEAVNYGSGNLTLDLFWYADTASSGNVSWEAQITAITPNTDSTDVETDSLATLNHVGDAHLGTVGQRLHQCTITISNTDSIAAGDLVWIRVARDADGTNNTDDMTGDAILVGAMLSYSDT